MLIEAMPEVAPSSEECVGACEPAVVPGPGISSVIVALAITIALASASCGTRSPILPAEVPLHLEEHFDAATLTGSEVSSDVPATKEWRFDRPQPDWKAALALDPASKPVELGRTEDALLLTLTEANAFVAPDGSRLLRGAVYLDLPDWKRDDWAHIVVEARTSDVFDWLIVGFNLRQQPGPTASSRGPFLFEGDSTPPISDGRVHTYLMRAD